MIFRLLASLALLLLIYWGMNSLSRRYALTRTQARWLLGMSMVLTGVVVLIVMGRLPAHFILAPLGVAATYLLRALPAMLRLIPLWQLLKGRTAWSGSAASRTRGHKSVIRTEFLAMELDHGSGNLDGEVLKGTFEGRRLSSLSLTELSALARACGGDQDSLRILEAYLDRMHPDWRSHFSEQQEADTGVTAEPPMSRQLALEILGLAEGATRDDVIRAHRKLMQKLHPDRGGSDYLAKKINAARDYLHEHTS